MLLAAACFFRNRSRTPLASLIIFVAFLSPVLGLIPFIYQNYSTVADRYAYLALLGPALLIARLLSHLQRPSYSLAAFEIALAFGVLSFAHSGIWKSSDTLWDGCLSENPYSIGCNNNKGLGLAQKAMLKEAEPYFVKSMEAKGAGSDLSKVAMSNLGLIYYSLGEYEKSVDCFYDLIKLAPYDPKSHLSRSKGLVKLKRYDEAIDETMIALRLHPERSDAIGMFDQLGDIFMLVGRYSDAFLVYQRALQMNPGMDQVQRKAATAAMKSHRYQQALWIYGMLQRKYPKDAEIESGLKEAARLSGE
jgi:tetratricopeptide (TPR) repeat protein